MLTIISPAKKLDSAPVSLALPVTQPVLLGDTEQLMKTTRLLKPKDLKDLMGISDKLADLNHARFQAFTTPFDQTNAKPAVLTFNGDVYLGLDAPSLDENELAWAQEHVSILSGLYGLLKPMDLMQAYRLEMGTRLKTARGKNLYAFWGDRVTNQLTAQLAEHTDNTVINLASKEYFKVVQPKRLPGAVVTPVFKEIKDGKARIISFFAKRARGLMTRFMVQERVDRPEGIKDFNGSGYRFNPALSTDDQWVFSRPR
jgi:cytoplasmic iron level regulating protein YaaA (DUF328/UPF0246 family)